MGKMRCSPYITPKRFLKMRCKKVPIKKNKYLSEKEYSVVDNDFVNRYILRNRNRCARRFNLVYQEVSADDERITYSGTGNPEKSV